MLSKYSVEKIICENIGALGENRPLSVWSSHKHIQELGSAGCIIQADLSLLPGDHYTFKYFFWSGMKYKQLGCYPSLSKRFEYCMTVTDAILQS